MQLGACVASLPLAYEETFMSTNTKGKRKERKKKSLHSKKKERKENIEESQKDSSLIINL
jgi:hypothetical protein